MSILVKKTLIIANSAGRVNCETTYYYDCLDVTYDGGSTYTSCSYSGSRTDCGVAERGDPDILQNEIIEAGPSAGGGGTGGASNSDKKDCVNPFDPELNVPCNDVTCGDGYVSNDNGGCLKIDYIDIDLEYLSLLEKSSKPLDEFDNRCSGMIESWDKSISKNKEVAGFFTTGGGLIITDVGSYKNSSLTGIYVHNGKGFYQWPESNGGPPSNIHSGSFYVIA